jgi:hypothetical protein
MLLTHHGRDPLLVGGRRRLASWLRAFGRVLVPFDGYPVNKVTPGT